MGEAGVVGGVSVRIRVGKGALMSWDLVMNS